MAIVVDILRKAWIEANKTQRRRRILVAILLPPFCVGLVAMLLCITTWWGILFAAIACILGAIGWYYILTQADRPR